MAYYLNWKWKIFIVGLGVISCMTGLTLLVFFLATGDIANDFGAIIAIELMFVPLGVELIYEGSKSKIEVFEDRIVYYQPRYVFSAQWSDISEIIPAFGSLTIKFSSTAKITGGLIYIILKKLNAHTSVPIRCYLNRENREVIKERIAEGIKIDNNDDMKILDKLM